MVESALLITSASDDFNSAEIGWLEGRLYDVLHNAVACESMNGNRPGDESLSLSERAVLERYAEPIIAALRACGAPPDTADQMPVPKGRKPARVQRDSRRFDRRGLLKPDTKLVPLRKAYDTIATVRADGQLDVAGQTYSSLSSAANASLSAIVAAQPARFPLKLTARYREQEIQAVVAVPGVVIYDDMTFKSPSTAANQARTRSGYAGAGPATTNGWTFWRFVDVDGVEKPLDALRGTPGDVDSS